MKFDSNDKNFSEFYSSSLKPKIKEFLQKSTKNKCYYCGKDCSSFKNSHSIPQFILKNLHSNNSYGNIYGLSSIEFMKGKTGINQAVSFYLLCNECENELFKYYEDPTIIDNFNEYDQKLLKCIALKDYLFQIYKANLNLSFTLSCYEICKNEHDNDISKLLDNNIDWNVAINLSNLYVYEKSIQYDKYYFNKDIYKTIAFVKLDYTVPIAMQTAISIYKSLNEIPLIYEKTNFFEPYNLCIFPLNNSSIVALFGYKYSKHTELLVNEFQLLSQDDILELINYIIFAFCEEYYFDNSIMEPLKKNSHLKELCMSKKRLDLSKYKSVNIPNILAYNIT